MGGLGGRWRAAAIVAAVVVLVLVVALASRPASIPGSAAGAAGGSALHVLADTGLYLFMVLLVVILGVAVWALWPEKRSKRERRRRPWWHLLVSYLTLLVMCALLLGLMRNPRALQRLRSSPLAQLGRGLRQQGPPVAQTPAASAGPDWAAVAIVALVVAAAVALVIWRTVAWRRRLRSPQDLALDLEHVLDASIGTLQEGAGEAGEAPVDARAAVIAAWLGFERVLAGAGLPIRPGEAPHEFLARALGEASLALDRHALRRFADLFEWARYSTNPVTESMRADAVATLTEVRRSLHHETVPDLHVVPT